MEVWECSHIAGRVSKPNRGFWDQDQGLWPQTLATVVTRGRTVHWDLEQQAVPERTLLSLLLSSSWVVVLVVGKGERKESCFFTSRAKPR